MEDGDLLGVYRDHLACLNNRQWNELGRFVADGVVYNGERLGINGYRAMLEADIDAIPDLQFTPEILLADHNVVACRLFFECNPRRVSGFRADRYAGLISGARLLQVRRGANRRSVVGDRQRSHS
jgi:predicted ester cyclase